MFEHYFLIAIRNFIKDKGYSVINLIGLSLAVACSFLFILWVQYENNYESGQKSRKDVYRVLTVEDVNGEIVKSAGTPGLLSGAIVKEFPAVLSATCFNVSRFPDVMVYNETPYAVSRGESDSSFFDVFDFEFLQGTPHTAFEGERPVVLSEEFAKKIFGNNSNIIGQPVYNKYKLWGGQFANEPPFIITAVVRIPENTHIRFDVLLDSGKTTQHGNSYRAWNKRSSFYTTFVKMRPDAVLDEAARLNMAGYLKKHNPEDNRILVFQPLADIHLKSEVVDTNLSGEFGEPRYIYIFLIMAFFILVIAVINYVNLSIARSANRTKEVGVRKVEGAYRRELIVQFLAESFIWAFIAMFIAFALAELLVPWFSGIIGSALTIVYTARTMLTALALALLVGLLTGGYSAFYLSSFRPALIIKGTSQTGSKAGLRKILLGIQLAISIFIMFCTCVVYKQLHFIQTKDPGFDRFNVIGIDTGLWYSVGDFKKEVMKNANVEAVSIACNSPFEMNWSSVMTWDGKQTDDEKKANTIWADWDYAKVFRLGIKQGQFLPENLGWWQNTTEESRSKILNETAARETGVQDIIGTKVNNGKVVGIVKDFNFRSFHEKISPLIIEYNPESSGKVFIRISPHNRSETLDYIKSTFGKFKKDTPFEYYFLDDEYLKMYDKEFRLGRVFLFFSLLSIFISCMGIFSLVAFMVQYRSKEISIRKINGAYIKDIILLFVRELSVLTVVSFVCAVPFAVFAMSYWLQNYQYRVGIGVFIFIGVLLLTWLLTMLTMSVQVYRAARQNPVESLKYE